MNATLEEVYTYHSPTPAQQTRYVALRDGGIALAKLITELTPQSRAQAAALTNVQQAVMWANAAIANEGGQS